MLKFFQIKRTNIVIFITSLIAISVSVFAEKFLNKQPCQLCLMTRVSYITIALLSCILFIYNIAIIRWILFYVILILLIFSFYHLGVENHWWMGPESCVAKLPSLNDIPQTTQFDVVYCDQVNLRIFGVSSTVWNFLLIAGLFWLSSTSNILNCYIKQHDE
ncbi:MAG: disulfide bond formation protein B [Holosporales bacterium]|nr:disulfide bond formation protein B [Holosporales bacterium]